MARLRQILAGCGFTPLELFGQYPRLNQQNRYVALDDAEDVLFHLWPSDRAGGFWIAVLVMRGADPTIDYRPVPCGANAIQQGLRRYFRSDEEWWAIASPGVFPKHPWVQPFVMGQPDAEDVGVPGVVQFLTEFPFAAPALMTDEMIVTVAGEEYRFAPTVAPANGRTREEDQPHAYTDAPRKIEL